MSDQILFDRLAYLDKLKSAGISDEHARAHADAMHEALRESVATKADVVLMRGDVAMLKRDLLDLEHRLTIRFGVMMAASVALLASIKFFGS